MGYARILQTSSNKNHQYTSGRISEQQYTSIGSSRHSKHVLHAATDQSASVPGLLPPAILIEDLSCTHNGGETYQLRDVSYVLPRGSKVALIGRNGCGKSSFLKSYSFRHKRFNVSHQNVDRITNLILNKVRV